MKLDMGVIYTYWTEGEIRDRGKLRHKRRHGGFTVVLLSSGTHTCTSVSLTEDTVSVDANASQLGSQPKALSGIEFHQTSFNQQVFKVRITLPLLQPAGQGESRHGHGLGAANGMEGWHGASGMPPRTNTQRHPPQRADAESHVRRVITRTHRFYVCVMTRSNSRE